jgi:hypothetical protein
MKVLNPSPTQYRYESSGYPRCCNFLRAAFAISSRLSWVLRNVPLIKMILSQNRDQKHNIQVYMAYDKKNLPFFNKYG